MAIKINGDNSTSAVGLTSGDDDSGIKPGSNQVEIVTGGTARVTVDNLLTTVSTNLKVEGSAIINDAGGGVDFRVESDNNENMLFVDGSADRVGIGTSTPVRVCEVSTTNTTAYNSDFQQQYNVLALRNTENDRAVGIEFKIGNNGEAAIGAVEASDTNTDLTFGTRSSSTRSEKMRITSGGNVNIVDGNLVIGTDGHGIDFSNQTGAAAAGAAAVSGGEVLDHYEEGTWTPNIGGPNSGVSYDIRWGRYTRIGNRVWVEGGLRPTNLNNLTGTANLARIRGLPFTIGNSSSSLTQNGGGAIVWYDGSEVSSHSHPMLTGGPQTDQILLFQKTTSASANATPVSFFKINLRLNFYFTYLVTN